MFRGVCLPPDPLCLIVDFCEGGSLKSYLQRKKVKKDIKLGFAYDIAMGMHHLHVAIRGKEKIREIFFKLFSI